jgi:hypothetical protein
MEPLINLSLLSSAVEKLIYIKKSTGRRRWRTYVVVALVPVADEHGVVRGGRRERDGDPGAGEHADAAEPAGRLVEGERGEVVVGADLVLGLQDVGEVGPRRDRARRPSHAVLERVPPLLETAPAHHRYDPATYISTHFATRRIRWGLRIKQTNSFKCL